MIGTAPPGRQISITGLGCKVPDRIVTNDEIARLVDRSESVV